METNYTCNKNTDSFMVTKMQELIQEDEFFEKWWTESNLGNIKGKISHDFDHKKNWSK